MNLGSVFNFLWIAMVLAMLLRDVWIGLGFTARQVAFFVLGMVAAGLLLGWLGLLKLFFRQRNAQDSEKSKRRRHGDEDR